MTSKEKPVLILGAGCFGLATAHHLASNGYTQVTVLEKADAIPSRFSAGYDLNKVVRAEYSDPFYTDLSLKAIRKWQTDPLYTPHYHQTGFLNVVSNAANPQTRQVVEKYLASIQEHRAFDGQVRRINGQAEIKKLVPAFQGPVKGWSGYFNELAGYCHSMNALEAVYHECVKLGVKFHLGKDDGEAESLLYASGRTGTKCVGAKSRGGHIYLADKTILALGASIANLIPQIGKQMTGRCWGVAHIQLTPEEAATLRGIPVTNVRDLAFFFEPDWETNKLKFCHMGGAFTNYAWSKDGLSLPFSELADSEFIPAEDEMYIRQLLQEVLPQFADRPLIDKHLCWVADTNDSHYIIDYVPGSGGESLVVLSGDSGHGFKMLPIFGEFVQRLLDEGCQSEARWKWKTQTSTGSAWRSSDSQELAGMTRAKL